MASASPTTACEAASMVKLKPFWKMFGDEGEASRGGGEVGRNHFLQLHPASGS